MFFPAKKIIENFQILDFFFGFLFNNNLEIIKNN